VPLLDHRMLVGAVVVEHQMNLDAPVLLIDHLRELEELLVPVPCIHAVGHLAAGNVERSEQGGGAVADVVMSPPLHLAGPHGEQRLGPNRTAHPVYSSRSPTASWSQKTCEYTRVPVIHGWYAGSLRT
jgi:hypothetical protein